MTEYKIHNPWGGDYRIKINVTEYQQNDALAIQLLSWNEEFQLWEHYGMLTVNLNDSSSLAKDCAFVDTNNTPNAAEFIEENGLGTFTGIMGFSGFCTYPCYKFNLDILKGGDK